MASRVEKMRKNRLTWLRYVLKTEEIDMVRLEVKGMHVEGIGEEKPKKQWGDVI